MRKGSQKGFTLLEIMAVIGVTAVLVTFALPRYASLQNDYALQSAASKLAADIRYAQQLAVDGGAPVTVNIRADGYTVSDAAGAVMSADFENGITAAGTYDFAFSSLGDPGSTQSVVLRNSRGGTRCVDVLSGTGKVVVR